LNKAAIVADNLQIMYTPPCNGAWLRWSDDRGGFANREIKFVGYDADVKKAEDMKAGPDAFSGTGF
jgi:hypothetical protein